MRSGGMRPPHSSLQASSYMGYKWKGGHCACKPGLGRGEPEKLGEALLGEVERVIYTGLCEYRPCLSVCPSTEWDHFGDSSEGCERPKLGQKQGWIWGKLIFPSPG